MSTASEVDQRRDPLALDPLSPPRDDGFVVDWQLDPPARPPLLPPVAPADASQPMT